MSESKFTPAPWSVGEIRAKGQEVWIDSAEPTEGLSYDHWTGLAVAYGCDEQPKQGAVVALANAERIVQCVNAHDALVEALRGFMALDPTFATVCDKHLDELARESELARVVKVARAALSKAGHKEEM